MKTAAEIGGTEIMTKKEVLEMLDDMEERVLRSNGFIAGFVTQGFILNVCRPAAGITADNYDMFPVGVSDDVPFHPFCGFPGCGNIIGRNGAYYSFMEDNEPDNDPGSNPGVG